MGLEGLKEEEIKSVLETYRTVAVVGLSRDADKYSHKVAKYLQSVGYKIIPVNPFADEILGEKAYRTILDIPEPIDIVDIFRPSKDVPSIIKEAIQLKTRTGHPNVIWMQLGIINEESATKAKKAGFTVIMDKCMMHEHNRLHREKIPHRRS